MTSYRFNPTDTAPDGSPADYSTNPRPAMPEKLDTESLAAYAMRLFDAAGELIMLGWISSLPARPSAAECWQALGALHMNDGSMVQHVEGEYRFTQHDTDPHKTRPSVMSVHHRPQLQEGSKEPTVHIHISDAKSFKRDAWREAHDLMRSTDLYVEIHGKVSPELVETLASGSPESLLGRHVFSTGNMAGDITSDVLDVNFAYQIIHEFAECVQIHGLGNVEPKPAEELTLLEWDALITCCAHVVDLDWSFQPEVADQDWLTGNAASVYMFLQPAPDE